MFKIFNLFRLLEEEIMEMFSTSLRNESKRKFAETKKVCQTPERRQYLSYKIQDEDFGSFDSSYL